MGIEPRPMLQEIAALCEAKLRDRDYREDWCYSSTAHLYAALMDEVCELRESFCSPLGVMKPADVIAECVDVINAAAMVIDRMGGIRPTRDRGRSRVMNT